MFDSIPLITDESLHVMLRTELSHFRGILEECQQDNHTLDEVIDMACEQFAESNPNLRKAVVGCALGVFGGLEEEHGIDIAWKAAVLTVPGVLTVLRLIDRQIEATEMEKKLNGG